VREQVVALTVTENGKSQRVLGKNGFEWFVTWKDKDLREDAATDSTVDLPTFRYYPGAKKAE
jgi:RimJ/RimL family protein N-acetyltransferase